MDRIIVSYVRQLIPVGIRLKAYLILNLIVNILPFHSFLYQYRRSIGRGDKFYTKSADCNVDVVCDEPVGWESEIRSAATVTIRGVGTCSGSMINNIDEDRTP